MQRNVAAFFAGYFFRFLLYREALIKSCLSFPRRREPSQLKQLDPRLRGDDDLISVSLVYG